MGEENMKANKKYILEADEHAVSAVIGVILMVAITVAIAATVYYYVTTMMPKTGGSAPSFQLSKDETEDKLVVVQAGEGADWARIGIFTDFTNSTITIKYALNNDSVVNSDVSKEPGNPSMIATTQTLMNAGDYLAFRATSDTAQNVKITLKDTVSNQIIGSYTFLSIAQI